MGIILVSALTMVMVNYSPMTALEGHRMLSSASEGFKVAEAGVMNYLDFNRDEDGYVIFPGNNVDMATLIYPSYGFMPARVGNAYGWEIKADTFKGMPAIGICLTPTKPIVSPQADIATKALAATARTMPEGSAYQYGNCFSTANNAAGLNLTRWIVLDHIPPRPVEPLAP